MKKEREYDILVCGYLCVDLVPKFSRPAEDGDTVVEPSLSPGTLTELDGMTFTLGGAVGNTGLVLHKIGKKVLLNGLVGDDHLGAFITAQLARYEVNNAISTIADAGTAFGIVLAPPRTDRLFLEYPGCSRFFDLAHVAKAQITASKLLHFGYAPLLKRFFENDGELLRQLLIDAKQVGTLTSMDLSLPDTEGDGRAVDWHRLMTHVLPFTDILLPSVEELLYMMMPDVYRELSAMHGAPNVLDHVPLETVQRLARIVLDLGVKIVMIKMAHRGIYLLTGNVSSLEGIGLDIQLWNHQELFCDAYSLDEKRVVNASGAGDAAVAAFLGALLDGESPKEALKLSAMAGRESLYCDDLYSELATWDEIANRVNLETVNVQLKADLITIN